MVSESQFHNFVPSDLLCVNDIRENSRLRATELIYRGIIGQKRNCNLDGSGSS